MDVFLTEAKHWLNSSPGLFIAVIVAVFAGTFIAAFIADRKRRREIEALSFRVGLRFFPKEADTVMEFLRNGNLPLFNEGHSRTAKNILTDSSSNTRLYAFDYQYTVGSGKNARTHYQTPVVFVSGSSSFPTYTVAPEGFLYKLISFVGYNDINFEEYPVFSKAYWLKSPQDAQVLRQAFRGAFMSLLEAEKGWHIQSSGPYVLFFKDGGHVKVAEYEEFLRKCKALFEALTANLQIRS
ncbi:MAG: hypothetical protein WCS77_09325 [Elusimicrobiaceae bacterium]|jgi:hypothetical protein